MISASVVKELSLLILFHFNFLNFQTNEYAKLMEMMDEYQKAQQKLQKGVDYNIKTVKAFATSLKRYFNFSVCNNGSPPNFK